MSQKSNTFTIGARDAKYLADVVLAAMSKDDVTPALTAARLTISDDKKTLTGISTDRYRVHEAYVALEKASSVHEILVPRDAWSWLSRAALSFSGRRSRVSAPVVKFTSRPVDEQGEGYLKIEVIQHRDTGPEAGSLARVGTLRKANFPPVDRLIREARAAELQTGELRLNPDLLAGLRPLMPFPMFAPTMRPTKTENPNKPGPVLFEFATPGKVHAVALIQPNLFLP
ncbi:hypothetical protein MN032_17700 [Agromyces atrinae]|uniref:hypothetical protein n=1 Tax=Agromyces atrinae TaxID=592376 RepID=UPI001F591CF0|nr:hypothetical protein [Agromyces atrinae]MCI2959523.1 hypothetical protein [Agromyces atrinae]